MPVSAFIAPAIVIDVVDRVAADPNFLIEVEHLEAFTAEHGPFPDAVGCSAAPVGRREPRSGR